MTPICGTTEFTVQSSTVRLTIPPLEDGRRLLELDLRGTERTAPLMETNNTTELKMFGMAISYRRDGAEGHAGRLYDALFRHFGGSRDRDGGSI